jgi:NAD(P)-dependent dehydrogenase (short-subunit alcohol dehydrogenase family)
LPSARDDRVVFEHTTEGRDMRAVVMGGTSGIGLAIAERLVQDGAEVIVTGRDEGRLAGAKARGLAAEQVDGTATEEVVGFLERVGAVDHLVLAFSPGAVGAGPLEVLSEQDLATALSKLTGYLMVVKHARVTGSITMISAASARAAIPGIAGLAAVNGAIERVVSPLAAELAPTRVNAVSPGVVETAWWSFLPEEQRSEQFAAVAGTLPIGRVGRPEDIAAAVAYLVTADYVTGTVLPVDGGFTVA